MPLCSLFFEEEALHVHQSCQQTDKGMLIAVHCRPDGWPHGADSIWQACDDASQCAQAAGSCPDDILMGSSMIQRRFWA